MSRKQCVKKKYLTHCFSYSKMQKSAIVCPKLVDAPSDVLAFLAGIGTYFAGEIGNGNRRYKHG